MPSVSTITGSAPAARPTPDHPEVVGPLGRLGRWTAGHVRAVAVAWVIVAVAFGVFAPKVETALSGAGWQANGSQSVQARKLIQANFAGLSSSALMVVVHSSNQTASAPAFRQTIARVRLAILQANRQVASVQRPQAGSSISARPAHRARDGRGERRPDGDGRRRGRAQVEAHAPAPPTSFVPLTGASGMWSDFNSANRSAMMKSELFSWPVTMVILVLAFGSLVAAGLPLLLTIVGLIASAGLLTLLTHGFEISIWAMNFALMFALALGIDYALFVVHRFRGAFLAPRSRRATRSQSTMDAAGKAVLFSGVDCPSSRSRRRCSSRARPSARWRSGSCLASSLCSPPAELLPAVLAKLGRASSARAQLGALGEHRSARFARWGERLWRHPYIFSTAATLILVCSHSRFSG